MSYSMAAIEEMTYSISNDIRLKNDNERGMASALAKRRRYSIQWLVALMPRRKAER